LPGSEELLAVLHGMADEVPAIENSIFPTMLHSRQTDRTAGVTLHEPIPPEGVTYMLHGTTTHSQYSEIVGQCYDDSHHETVHFNAAGICFSDEVFS
jgi:hypothetical protein